MIRLAPPGQWWSIVSSLLHPLPHTWSQCCLPPLNVNMTSCPGPPHSSLNGFAGWQWNCIFCQENSQYFNSGNVSPDGVEVIMGQFLAREWKCYFPDIIVQDWPDSLCLLLFGLEPLTVSRWGEGPQSLHLNWSWMTTWQGSCKFARTFYLCVCVCVSLWCVCQFSFPPECGHPVDCAGLGWPLLPV